VFCKRKIMAYNVCVQDCRINTGQMMLWPESCRRWHRGNSIMLSEIFWHSHCVIEKPCGISLSWKNITILCLNHTSQVWWSVMSIQPVMSMCLSLSFVVLKRLVPSQRTGFMWFCDCFQRKLPQISFIVSLIMLYAVWMLHLCSLTVLTTQCCTMY